jgi:hypothetical protein
MASGMTLSALRCDAPEGCKLTIIWLLLHHNLHTGLYIVGLFLCDTNQRV